MALFGRWSAILWPLKGLGVVLEWDPGLESMWEVWGAPLMGLG